MDPRDSPHPSGFQLSSSYHASFLPQYRSPPFPHSHHPSSPSHHPHQPQPHHHHHHHQQQQQQQQQQPQPHHHHHHHQQQQQQQPPPPPPPSSLSSRSPQVLPSIIHAPSAVRFSSPSPPHPNSTPPNPNSNPSPFPPDSSPHLIQHQLLPAPSPPSGMAVNTAMALSRSDPVKRKRGRPRKYATDANGAPLAMSPLRSSPQEKKAAKGTGKKYQLSSLGITGQGFTPHVLSVGAGEDVAEKITSFSQHGPWAVCILSANGAISNAMLWHSGSVNVAMPYEGHFEILSLSGLFLQSENGQRTGGLSVSLAGPDGRVLGGRIAGPLRAASPIQVIVGTFFAENRKKQTKAGNGGDASYMVSDSGTRHGGMTMEQMQHLEASRNMQEMRQLTGVDKEHHVSHVMPLQSIDWGVGHYDVESRSHNEQMQSAHGE